jgi:O-acetyl-ADP-ribose deacetylase
MKVTFRHGTLTLKLGDLTKERADAIVNAANSSLMGGGGVDGAIHLAGGPKILKECRRIVERIGRLASGDVVITTGGNLPAGKVIHTVGPIWGGGYSGERDTLRRCYLNSLELARKENLRSVAFPSISTGVYRYPLYEAARVALAAVIEFLNGEELTDANMQPMDVIFVLFNEKILTAYTEALREGIEV